MCFRSVLIWNHDIDNREGITFSCRIIFVSPYRKVLWGTLHFFRKSGASNNFTFNRGYHDFPLKSLSLTASKNRVFTGEPFFFVFPKTSGREEVYVSENGGGGGGGVGVITFFGRVFCVSQYRKIS